MTVEREKGWTGGGCQIYALKKQAQYAEKLNKPLLAFVTMFIHLLLQQYLKIFE